MEELLELLIIHAPVMLKYSGYIAAGSIGLRGLAEILNYISIRTETTKDDKVAYYVSEVAWIATKITAILAARSTISRPPHLREDDK